MDKTNSSDHEHTNLLIHETSPYLLQHAHNPVNWHPWGEDALAEAKKEDKLLIVSIGYAACHWCHVMEHESFEDSLVASIMNEHFIPIKVDREERPDIDDVYMTACNLINGSGGWPLNAIALPDGSPIWAGTYFPKDNWLKLLQQFVDLKETDYAKLKESAEKLTAGVQSTDDLGLVTDSKEFTQDELNVFNENLLKISDQNLGGRMGAPKFPMPSIYEYMLKQYKITGDESLWKTTEITLDKMAAGGIYDHLGGGFARYSVDEEWLVPHFEKMLYDNAQLVSLYSKAYALSGKKRYLEVIIQSLAFVQEELTDDTGAFYSSLDADSEGEEGKYYVWTADELKNSLGDRYALFADYYDVSDQGNWEHNNILNRKIPLDKLQSKHSLNAEEITSQIQQDRETLLQIRSQRVKPGLDDKAITSWNALMITGYIDAYKATKNQDYKAAAFKNLDFILKNQMSENGQLKRNYKDGKSTINAFLDDYALLISALIDCYEVSFDSQYLDIANTIATHAMEHFFDESNGMFHYTSDLDPPLVARKKELADNVIPGSNSAIARALHELGTLRYEEKYIEVSTQMLTNMHAQLTESDRTDFYCNWAQLYNDLAHPIYEVAIVGINASEARDEIMTHFMPDALLLGGQTEGNLALLEGKLVEGETYIYVCQNKVCKFPVTEITKALALMKR